jgi:hypothetical protein
MATATRETYTIEVCGSFGGYPPWTWTPLKTLTGVRRDEVKKACQGLTGGHYRAARAKDSAGHVVCQSGADVG